MKFWIQKISETPDGSLRRFGLVLMFLGLVFVEVTLKLTPISNLFDKHLILNLSNEPQILVWLFGFSLVMGLISGIYS